MEQRLSKQRLHPASRGLGELETIVVNIFNSLDGGSHRVPASGAPLQPPPRARSRPVSSSREENIVHREAWTAPADSLAEPTEHRDRRAAGPAADPATAPLPPANESGPDGAAEQAEDADFLLNEEEERFVEQTVAWLSNRPNPDILLDRIWNRLIDLTPGEEANLPSGDEPAQNAHDGGKKEGEG